MKDCIKSLMFAGMVMVMGSANAVEPAGAADAVALVTPLTVEQQQLLKDIVDQTGLRDGKLDGRAVTKENVIDAIRRTVESYGRTKELLAEVMADILKVMPEGAITPRGVVYEYNGQQDLNPETLKLLRMRDIIAVKKAKEKSIHSFDAEAVRRYKDIKSIASYIEPCCYSEDHSVFIALHDFIEGANATPFQKYVIKILMDEGYIKRDDTGKPVVSEKKFGLKQGMYYSEKCKAIEDEIVDLCVSHSQEVEAARAVGIRAVKKQSKADWYNKEIRPTMGLDN